MSNSNLEAALEYMRLGWWVIPLHHIVNEAGHCSCGCTDPTCHSRGKHPRIGWRAKNGGVAFPFPDEAAIKEWWGKWPNANVGILCGPSGLLVLDADGDDGKESAAKFKIPPTPTQQTPNGFQWVFRHPGGKIPNSVKDIAPGFDIRADGGLIAVPPSNHFSGESRLWLVSPQDADPAPTPGWLSELVTAGAESGAAAIVGAVIPDGERNTTIASLLGSLRNRGGEENELLALAREVNARCDPPLPEPELRTIAKSIASYPVGKIELHQTPPPLGEAAIVGPVTSGNGKNETVAPTAPTGATWQDMDALIGPIEWEWPPWMSKGLLTLVAGEPGQGKSVLMLRIAATYLLGWPWPDGTPFNGETGGVLWCESEAAQAINLDRAKQWGLPLEQFYTALSNPLDDVQLDRNEHQDAIEGMAHRDDIAMIIVDSLRGAHRRDENSSATMEVCKWLAELARDTGKPVLLSHHLRKRGMLDVADRVTLDRIRGSSAIIQTARMVWAIDAPDLDFEDSKRLSVIKSNLARFPEPVGFTIGDKMHLTFGDAPEALRQETQMDKAIDLLRVLLASGPVPSTELREESDGAGISWDTMKRAQGKLGIVPKRDGKARKWLWALPARGKTH